MSSRKAMISVIGASKPSTKGLALAESVGVELANRGAVVICGGLGGIMEAVCRGAKKNGGTTIGILPSDNPSEANSYVDFPIATGMGHARNVIVVSTGEAVIAIDGAYGTLSEIGHALAAGIPVIGLNTWELPSRIDLPIEIIYTHTAAEAVDKAFEATLWRKGRHGANK